LDEKRWHLGEASRSAGPGLRVTIMARLGRPARRMCGNLAVHRRAAPGYGWPFIVPDLVPGGICSIYEEVTVAFHGLTAIITRQCSDGSGGRNANG
jgi:hypothetical protein